MFMTASGVSLCSSLTTIVARVAYGIEINGTDDERYKMLERILHVGEEIAVPGRFAVEALPILRYLPSWLPGVEFRSFAKEAKRDVLYTTEKLYREGVEKMVGTSCVTADNEVVEFDVFCYRILMHQRTSLSPAF